MPLLLTYLLTYFLAKHIAPHISWSLRARDRCSRKAKLQSFQLEIICE